MENIQSLESSMRFGFEPSLGVLNISYAAQEKLLFIRYLRKMVGWYLLSKTVKYVTF